MQPLDAIAERALTVASRLHPEYAEAYVQHSRSQGFPIEQGKFNGGGFSEDLGVRIRIIKDKRLYTLSTNKPGDSDIAELLKGYKTFKGLNTVLAPAPVEKDSYRVDERKCIDDADLLKDLKELDKTLVNTGVVKYRVVYGMKGRDWSCFMNTEGSEIKSDVPYAQVFTVFTAASGTETRQSPQLFYGGAGGYERLDFHSISNDLTTRANNLKNAMEKGVTLSESAIAKMRNVVVGPEISGIAVHESVGHPCESDRIFGRESAQAGLSYLTKDNLGMRIGSNEVTIIDNPTLPNTSGYFKYDDEGVRARPKVLVEKGFQKELLTNREFAHALHAKSNGSARSSSFANEPLVRMSNSYVERGNSTMEELLAEAKDGVYMKSFTEWNIDDTRSFSRYQGCEAFEIKNGSMGRPLKNFRLEKGTLQFWNAVKMRGSDFGFDIAHCGKGEPGQGVPVCMGGPSMLLRFGD